MPRLQHKQQKLVVLFDAENVSYNLVPPIDGVCLASSDSDLTPLAYCIRREGLRVYGFGARQTPRAFVAACSRFIYTESMRG